MGSAKKSEFRSGTSGLTLPVPNKKAFPPEFQDKSRLTFYSSLVNSLEINSSFYKLPQPRTIEKWVEMVPDNFTFTFKLWKEITHVKDFAFKSEDVVRFIDIVDRAEKKKGAILVQFPPSITVEKFGRLEELLSIFQETGHEWNIALEFRHSSWYIGETYELADEYRSGIVMHDIPKSRHQRTNDNAPFIYLRFHGPAGDYRGGYSDEYLKEQAKDIRKWRREGKDVYAYFNNTIGDALANVMTLNRMVR